MTLGEAIDDPTSNDDYVAKLLTSEAKDKSIKYSSLGLQAYLPRRPTDRAPKPNTRFLRNILRDTDSHNAALRRKEAEEARERMRQLRGEQSPSGGRSDRHRERERSHRDRSPCRREKNRSSKRRRLDDDTDRDHKSRSRRHRRRYEDDESESDRERSSRSHRRHREERRSARTRDSSRSRHRSSRYNRDTRSKSPSRSRSRSRSPEVSRRHRDDNKSYERAKSVNGDSRVESEDRLEARKDYNSDDESDPLEDLVGPQPASSRRREQASSFPTRGRGSYRINTSTIDSHFAHNYDPKLDVDISENDEDSSSKAPKRRPVAGLMTEEEDDWDMALEALRDRANWKQKGEERLRAAGFNESTVQRWKQEPAFAAGSGHETEGRIEDVKWAKKGEGREWDRGKVMNDDGHYDVKTQW